MPRKQESATPAAVASEDSPSSNPHDKSKEKDKDKERDKDKDKDKEKEPTTIEDLSLPRSIITRLAKGILPPNTQIQGNAVLALSKSATVFISYLASHANENTVAAGKKTIAPGDVFKALDDTEFGFLKDRLEAEYKKFNAIQTEKRTSYRQKVKAAKSTDDTEMGEDDTHDAPRAAKKQRVDPHGQDEDDDDPEHDDDMDDHDDDDDDDDDDVEEDVEEDSEGTEDEPEREREGERDTEEVDEALDGDESD